MTIPFPVALGIMAIAAVVSLYGWLNARLRTTPPEVIRVVVGPIEREYLCEPAALHAAMLREVGRVRGCRVARSTPTSLDVAMRPSLARADDGMGLFVHIEVSATRPGHSLCRMHGQPKSALAIGATSERALGAFERELRMGMKSHERIVVRGSAGPSILDDVAGQSNVVGGQSSVTDSNVSPWWDQSGSANS